MKVFQKLLSLVLVSLLLGGCTLTGAVPVAAGSAGESSSAAESNTASVRPQNKPNASSRAEEDKSSSREEEASAPPSSSAVITPADAAKETEALTALLTALLRMCRYPAWMLVWTALIAAARVLALVLRLRKGNRTPPHTFWDKAAGAVLFVTPVLVHFAGAWGIMPALVAASAGAASQFSG